VPLKRLPRPAARTMTVGSEDDMSAVLLVLGS
jgi:hypothetical protein